MLSLGQLAHVGDHKYPGQVPPTSVFLQKENKCITAEANSATFCCCSPTKEKQEINFKNCYWKWRDLDVPENNDFSNLVYNWGFQSCVKCTVCPNIRCELLPPVIVTKGTLGFESGADLLDLLSCRSYLKTEMASVLCHVKKMKIRFSQAGKEKLWLDWYQPFAPGKGRVRTGARLSFSNEGRLKKQSSCSHLSKPDLMIHS